MLALHSITMTDSDAAPSAHQLLFRLYIHLDAEEYRYIFSGGLVPAIMRQTVGEALVRIGLLIVFQQKCEHNCEHILDVGCIHACRQDDDGCRRHCCLWVSLSSISSQTIQHTPQ